MSKSLAINVSPVEEADLNRCAEIFLSAFADDALFHILRPARLADPSLSHSQRLANSAASLKKAHLNQDSKAFLKAVESDTGRIVGVAIWIKPGHPVRPVKDKKETEEAAQKDPEDDAEAFGRLVEEMNYKRERVMGDQPHWYLSLLIVDPSVHGKGVGKQLLAWAIDQADSASPPLPCVLEASRAGRPVYEKRGFKEVDECIMYVKDGEGKKIEGSDFSWPVMLRKARQ